MLQRCRAFGAIANSELKVDPQTGESIGIMWLEFGAANAREDAAACAAAAQAALHRTKVGTETVQVTLDRERAAYIQKYRQLLGDRYAKQREARRKERARHEAEARARRAEQLEAARRAEQRDASRRAAPAGGSWRAPPKDAPASARSDAERRVAALGHDYLYVPRVPSRAMDAATLRSHLASFQPEMVLDDERGWYVGFRRADAAARCRMVLGADTLSGYRLTLELRTPHALAAERPPSKPSAPPEPMPAERAPARARTYTRAELLDEAARLLLSELTTMLTRDITTRTVTPIVQGFLRPDGPGGQLLAQHHSELKKRPSVAKPSALPSFRRLEPIPRRPGAEAPPRTPVPRKGAPKRAAAAGATPTPGDATPTPDDATPTPGYATPRPGDATPTPPVAPEAPLPLLDPVALGVVRNAEELRYFDQILAREARGDDAVGTEPDSAHDAGSARAQGFYRIPARDKALHVPDRNRASTEALSASALASARHARADSRRLALDLEQHKREILSDTDLLHINQLQTRKKQLKFAKSPIHDWGLYAMELIPAGDMVIEYVGEIVRQQVADHREKMYERAVRPDAHARATLARTCSAWTTTWSSTRHTRATLRA